MAPMQQSNAAEGMQVTHLDLLLGMRSQMLQSHPVCTSVLCHVRDLSNKLRTSSLYLRPCSSVLLATNV